MLNYFYMFDRMADFAMFLLAVQANVDNIANVKLSNCLHVQ